MSQTKRKIWFFFQDTVDALDTSKYFSGITLFFPEIFLEPVMENAENFHFS